MHFQVTSSISHATSQKTKDELTSWMHFQVASSVLQLLGNTHLLKVFADYLVSHASFLRNIKTDSLSEQIFKLLCQLCKFPMIKTEMTSHPGCIFRSPHQSYNLSGSIIKDLHPAGCILRLPYQLCNFLANTDRLTRWTHQITFSVIKFPRKYREGLTSCRMHFWGALLIMQTP